MPENNPIKHDDPKVDVDTSGPEVEVSLPEEKAEEVVNTTEAPKQETVDTTQAQLYEENCFITLTYNDENIPPAGS